MNNPQYTEQQAQLLYDVLIHHSAATLMPHFDTVAARELDQALAVLPESTVKPRLFRAGM